MSQKRYFKEEIMSVMLEAGFGYHEYTDEICTRQIIAFANQVQLFSQASVNTCNYLTDQRPNNFLMNGEISESEFDRIWARGVEFPNLKKKPNI